MKRFLGLFTAGILLVGCLTACGVDKEALADINARLTQLDTKASSMYGKIEDMYSTGKITEDIYMEFMNFDKGIDEAIVLSEEKRPDMDALQLKTSDLESKLKSFETALEMLSESNAENLDRELLELKQAAVELGEIMAKAVEAGKITQARMDEFTANQNKIEKYLSMVDLEYSDKVAEDIADIRSTLSVMASEVNADNNLIDRLVDNSAFNYNNEENSQETTGAVAEATSEKKPLSQDVEALINNYLAFQEFAVNAHTNGVIDDAKINEVLSCGVQLTYLKEAVEQDGVTENNTMRANNIKADIYELAKAMSYDKADLFAAK